MSSHDRSSAGAVSRRAFGRRSIAGVCGLATLGWWRNFAAQAAVDPSRRRSCVFIWLNGGPSTIDLWDLKPGHKNGGPYRELETTVPGMRISEHLPNLAAHAQRLAIIRSMSTAEGDHRRASDLVRTGYKPTPAVDYPSIGSLVAKELHRDDDDALPSYVCISSRAVRSSSGFLGPHFAPLVIGERTLDEGGAMTSATPDVPNLSIPEGVDAETFDARWRIRSRMNARFEEGRSDATLASSAAAYGRTFKLIGAGAGEAFSVESESHTDRERYGRSLFGQGCLLARRLVEQQVPFVEVVLDGWDTHSRNFESVEALSGSLDAGMSALIGDLSERGLLDSTLICCFGEFGRTPKINEGAGRDHYPAAWSAVLAGGGIRGGQTYGRTSDDGMEVVENPTGVPDLLATICRGIGIDPSAENESTLGRPIRLTDASAKPIEALLQ